MTFKKTSIEKLIGLEKIMSSKVFFVILSIAKNLLFEMFRFAQYDPKFFSTFIYKF